MSLDPRVQKLLEIPQYEQRTPEWYKQRENAITASDLPTVLGENKYKTAWNLLVDKCNANPKPFTGNAATQWGNHYEDIAIDIYSEQYHKKVLSFGLLIHPEYSWLGGSPDGITTDGILLEVKCPIKRKIVMGEVPHHYLSQVLLNLEICDLEIAHFIEYLPGLPGKSDNEYTLNVVEVKRDREWFAKEYPKIKDFWDSVLFYRREGIEKHPKYRAPRQKQDPGITLDLDPKPKAKKLAFTAFVDDPDDQEN
jgi:putative phage-type endonuclease